MDGGVVVVGKKGSSCGEYRDGFFGGNLKAGWWGVERFVVVRVIERVK